MTPLITTAIVSLAALVYGRRSRKRTRQLAFRDTSSSGLPQLSAQQCDAVMKDAEKAALRVALGDKVPSPNPHPRGTRANIIWETHFHSVLMDWESRTN